MKSESGSGTTQGVLEHILVQTIEVSKAAFTLDSAVIQLEADAEAQTHAVGRIIDEARMGREGSERVASLAQELSTQSDTARTLAGTGLEVRERFADEFAAIRHVFSETATFTADLKNRSADIRRLSTVLRDMADQLNILAINTAIEAARAGTAGRGFAVIAREMKKLYSRVSDSAQEVALITEGIVDGIASSDAALKGAGETLESSSHNAERIGGILCELADANTILSTRTAEIADWSSTQIDVNRTIEDLARSTGTGSERIKAEASGSRQLADRVHKAVDATLVTLSGQHFSWQERAAKDMEQLVQRLAIQGEGALAAAFERFASFELFYIIDAKGIQTSPNIWKPSLNRDGSAEKGRSRANKPYFTRAMAHEDRCVFSDLYVSSATGTLCITASRRFEGPGGPCVLAADIDLDGLLSLA